MTHKSKLMSKILSGKSDTNINFRELCSFLESIGFEIRTKGSHFIFRKIGIPMMITLQNDGTEAKPYQIKQIRKLLINYNLGDIDV